MCPATLTEKKFAPPLHPSILQAEWHAEESPGEPEIVRLLGKRRWGMSASPSCARRLCALYGRAPASRRANAEPQRSKDALPSGQSARSRASRGPSMCTGMLIEGVSDSASQKKMRSPSPVTRRSLLLSCRSRTYRGIFAPRRRWRRRPRPCSSATIGTRFQGPGKKAKDRPNAPDSTAPRTVAPAGKRLSLP